MSIDLANRVLIITGASSGIGAATAIAGADAGLNLVLHGRNAGRLEQVAAEIHRRGRRTEVVTGDVTEAALTARLLDTAERAFGGFYAVFANAGIGLKKACHELSTAELRQVFEVNFFTAYDLIQAAARRLIAAGRPGHLLMCSSALAKFTLPGVSAYSASKAAQNHICRAMRMELRPHHIEVASVHPITTRTAFFERAAQLSGVPYDPDQQFGGVANWFVQDPQTVARAVVRCLRHPRPEVWTSFGARLMAGLMTVFPRTMDFAGRRA